MELKDKLIKVLNLREEIYNLIDNDTIDDIILEQVAEIATKNGINLLLFMIEWAENYQEVYKESNIV